MTEKHQTSAKSKANDNVRLIKKYPNRRLYDMKNSCYITLDDIHKMLRNNHSIKVINAKNGEDLTRSTLLQIIYDQEEQNAPLLSADLLKAIIEFYDDPMHGMFSRFLEHSISVYKEHQTDLKSPINSQLTLEAQATKLHNLAEQNYKS